MQVCRAVRKRDHLRESVGPLGAAQQRGVADLSAEAAGWTAAGGSQRSAEERHCGCGRHFGGVFAGDVFCLAVEEALVVDRSAASQRGGEP